MIYRLTHTTTYQYSGTVSLSHHLLRLRPRDLPATTVPEPRIANRTARPDVHVRASRLLWQCHHFRHH